MSRGYSATPLWGLSRNSAVAGIFVVKIYRLYMVRISALRWTEFHQNRKDPMWEINLMSLDSNCRRGRDRTVRATTRSGYMMTSPSLAKWRPRRGTRGKVTSWPFAAPRSVLSPYYFESCELRQWEIRGVKKKCRPMNVCAFLGGKTTEHESFSAQRNARQGAKHRKKEVECHFLDLWKKIFLKST